MEEGLKEPKLLVVCTPEMVAIEAVRLEASYDGMGSSGAAVELGQEVGVAGVGVAVEAAVGDMDVTLGVLMVGVSEVGIVGKVDVVALDEDAFEGE